MGTSVYDLNASYETDSLDYIIQNLNLVRKVKRCKVKLKRISENKLKSVVENSRKPASLDPLKSTKADPSNSGELILKREESKGKERSAKRGSTEYNSNNKDSPRKLEVIKKNVKKEMKTEPPKELEDNTAVALKNREKESSGQSKDSSIKLKGKKTRLAGTKKESSEESENETEDSPKKQIKKKRSSESEGVNKEPSEDKTEDSPKILKRKKSRSLELEEEKKKKSLGESEDINKESTNKLDHKKKALEKKLSPKEFKDKKRVSRTLRKSEEKRTISHGKVKAKPESTANKKCAIKKKNIFIRLPTPSKNIIAKEKTNGKIEENIIPTRDEGEELKEAKLREKFGSRVFRCHVKVPRNPYPSSYSFSNRGNKNKSVSFIDTVKIIGYSDKEDTADIELPTTSTPLPADRKRDKIEVEESSETSTTPKTTKRSVCEESIEHDMSSPVKNTIENDTTDFSSTPKKIKLTLSKTYDNEVSNIEEQSNERDNDESCLSQEGSTVAHESINETVAKEVTSISVADSSSSFVEKSIVDMVEKKPTETENTKIAETVQDESQVELNSDDDDYFIELKSKNAKSAGVEGSDKDGNHSVQVINSDEDDEVVELKSKEGENKEESIGKDGNHKATVIDSDEDDELIELKSENAKSVEVKSTDKDSNDSAQVINSDEDDVIIESKSKKGENKEEGSNAKDGNHSVQVINSDEDDEVVKLKSKEGESKKKEGNDKDGNESAQVINSDEDDEVVELKSKEDDSKEEESNDKDDKDRNNSEQIITSDEDDEIVEPKSKEDDSKEKESNYSAQVMNSDEDDEVVELNSENVKRIKVERIDNDSNHSAQVINSDEEDESIDLKSRSSSKDEKGNASKKNEEPKSSKNYTDVRRANRKASSDKRSFITAGKFSTDEKSKTGERTVQLFDDIEEPSDQPDDDFNLQLTNSTERSNSCEKEQSKPDNEIDIELEDEAYPQEARFSLNTFFKSIKTKLLPERKDSESNATGEHSGEIKKLGRP